jgi:hypothetical protein
LITAKFLSPAWIILRVAMDMSYSRGDLADTEREIASPSDWSPDTGKKEAFNE